MPTAKETIRKALEAYRGDNLYRAQAAFRNCTPQQMQEQYGQSGQTRQEIVDGYQRHEDAVNAAIRWLSSAQE